MGLPDPFPLRRDRTGRTWRRPTTIARCGSQAPARLARAGLALLDTEAWELASDVEALRQLSEEPGFDPSWAGRLLAELYRFARTWSPATAPAGPRRARSSRPARAPQRRQRARVTAIGHAHIDTAWLWPLAETRRKIVRSWSSQLALMDRYPEHRFAASSAQHYAWFEQDAPLLYEHLAIGARGRWEVVGGSWVEPDLNLPSGESLVRQLLYGQRDLLQRFGARCREFWTPDTFGYNGQVPQILRGAGIDRFLTQKLSWNPFTEPPHHSFAWAGIDGSRVLVHMPPADTYNAELSIAELRASAARFKDHDRTAGACSCSATATAAAGRPPRCSRWRAELATCRACRACSSRPPPSSSTGSRRTSATRAPIVGELYFEYHRGTYTSQARTKRGNRAASGCCTRPRPRRDRAPARPADYPAQELRALWQTLLLNQFHDILPGSSIREVYEDAERDHARVAARATELRDAAIAALGDGEPTPLNLTPFAREEVVERDGALHAVRAPAYGFGQRAELADTCDATASRSPTRSSARRSTGGGG